jgi:hypothetical protein
MIATLLKTSMCLPGAIPGPSALLLPRGCLLAGPLRLLLLPGLLSRLGGALLRLPRLRSWLGGALLRLPGLRSWLGGALLRLPGLRSWLGGALLRLPGLRSWLGVLLLLLFRLRLGMLLLCRSRRGLPGLWFGFRFLLLFVLGVGRDNCPEKHKNGSGINNSNDLHGHYLR